MNKLLYLTIFITVLHLTNAFTQNGAHLVRDLTAGPDGSFDADGTGIKATVDSFAILIASGEGGALLLCRSDGSEAGTYPIIPAYSPDNVSVSGFLVNQGLCWFVVNNQGNSLLYSTDGTLQGTKLRYTQNGSGIYPLRAYGNDILMGIHPSGFTGDLLSRFHTSDNSVSNLYNFYWFGGLMDVAVAGNTIYAIGAADSTGRHLMKSADGSPGSLSVVTKINTGSEFNQNIFMTASGNNVFFFWAKAGENYKLWFSDGTAGGTIGLKEFDTPSFENLVADKGIIAYNNKLIFRAASTPDGLGEELYISDGTVTGTKLLKDLNSGSGDSRPKDMFLLHNKVWLSARNEYYNYDLWSTDGTPSGTTMPLSSFGFNYINSPVLYRDSIAMDGLSTPDGEELFISNGTTGGTKAITYESLPSHESLLAGNLAPAGKKLYFTASKPATGKELWVFEGNFTSAVHELLYTPNRLEVYPNPGSDALHIVSDEPFVVEIFNSDGRLMTRQTTERAISIPTQNWTPSLYIVKLTYKEGVHITNWVKGF